MVYSTSRCGVQLPFGLDGLLAELSVEAAERWGVPENVAEGAVAATRRNIGWDDSRPARSRARATSYYWGALRGIVLRSRSVETASLRARFALATIVEDMRSRGIDRQQLRDAVVASHGDLLRESGMSAESLDVAC